ncbi:MAG: family 43 glycosylhydrolase [bacterium]|nr:family 43 glycosylhydrolase [bacterium]
MRKFFIFLVLLSIIFLKGDVYMIYAQTKELKYKNPLNVYKVADPFVLFYKGKFYLYATSESGAGIGGGFEVWESSNLVDWIYKGWAYKSSESSWGKESFWAPEVLYRDGRFYLFYSARGELNGRKTLRICLAVSDSPIGPFNDIKAPLFDLGYATIDAHPFVDEDGEVYLYYARDVSENPTSDIYVVKLSKDLLSIKEGPKFLTTPSQFWESSSKWNEGPFVVKYNKRYYLFYSANFFSSPDYSVGYAVSDSPMGPFKKADENPILRKNDYISGPGHNSVIKTPDGKEYFIVYHTQMKREGTHLRQLAIDRLIFDKDGKVRVVGPTYLPQPYPSGTPRPKTIATDDFSYKSLDLNRWLITGYYDYSLEERPGYLRIKTMISDIKNFINTPLNLSNIFTQYSLDESFEVLTQFEVTSGEIMDRAGLIVFEDYNNYLEFVRVQGEDKSTLEFIYKKGDNIQRITVEKIPKAKRYFLKLKKDKDTWSAFYKFSEKEDWKKVNKSLVCTFNILRVGITAYSYYSIGGCIYDFDKFEYIKTK